MVANELNLPFVYSVVKKDHGLKNLIEGDLRPGQKVVIIEDLISTGANSLKAVEAIRKDGCKCWVCLLSSPMDFQLQKTNLKMKSRVDNTLKL